MSKLNSQTAGLNEVRCLELRKLMHELSNVTTGILISSGLLAQLLIGDKRRRYCEQINEAGERTAVLVERRAPCFTRRSIRELRRHHGERRGS